MAHVLSFIVNQFLIIWTICPSEALTVCIGLLELIGNSFGELEFAMFGGIGLEVRSSLGLVAIISWLRAESIPLEGKLIVPVAEVEPDSFARPLHLKYRKCTIFLDGSYFPFTHKLLQ